MDAYVCISPPGDPKEGVLFNEHFSECRRAAFIYYAYACLNPNEVPIPKGSDRPGGFVAVDASPTESYPSKNGFDYSIHPYLFTCGSPQKKQALKNLNLTLEKTVPQRANGRVGLCGSYGFPAVTVGNPIVVTTGNKVHIETDHEGAGPFPLLFQRAYNSQAKEPRLHWQHTYERHLFKTKTLTGTYAIEYVRGDGQVEYFNPTGATTYRSATDSATSLAVGDKPNRYLFTDEKGLLETLEDLGKGAARLLELQNAQGFVQTFSYDGANRLIAVTDPFGRALHFEYDPQGLLTTLIDPAGHKTLYQYDGQKRLTEVIHPDGSKTIYHYEDPKSPFLLTGITDPLGKRIATWHYDAKGRAILSEHAGGVERVTLAFDDDVKEVTVLNVLGKASTYAYEVKGGIPKPTTLDGVFCQGCESQVASYNYDARGFLTQITDPNGTIEKRTFNAEGMPQSITRAADTDKSYTTRYAWHKQWKQPTEQDEPDLKVLWGYNARGQVGSETAIDKKFSGSRTRTFQYNDKGLLASLDGTRLDVEDKETFTYDTQGNLIARKNALGHTVRLEGYDPNGYPRKAIDENGQVIQLSYNWKGQVAEVNHASASWKYSYNANGQLVQIQNPLSQSTHYVYDEAHRLTTIVGPTGQKTEFNLNPLSATTALSLYDEQGTLTYQQQYTYNDLGQLTGVIDGNGMTTSYQYDPNGYVTLTVDPKKRTTRRQYDVLNHPTQFTLADATVTQFQYSPQGRLLALTDTLGHTTQFTYNGFGELISLQSPDSGQTQFQYTEGGLLKQVRTADGQQMYYNYDALNRVTSKTHSDKQHAVQFQYDANPLGVGRLTSIQDDSGNRQYGYDPFENRIRVTLKSNNLETTLQWRYDPNQHVTGIRYPSGHWVEYERDTNGHVQGITYQDKSIVSGVKRLPAWGTHSPVTQYQLGSGITVSHAYDKAYFRRKTTWVPLPQAETSFQYDSVYNLVGLETPKAKQSYQYDLLDRLIGANPFFWTYDALGNRLSEQKGDMKITYSYQPESAEITEMGKTAFTHDAVGRATQKGDYTYTYGSHQQLTQVSYQGSIVAEYTYNAYHQRTKKVVYENAVLKTKPLTTYFVYDLEGRLIAELSSTGAVEREYLYLDQEPVALVEGGEVYYFLNSKLGAPQLLVDSKQQVVWEADDAPFGEVVMKVEKLTQNLRFPGQYYDAESGLHYNWHRYYDPALGRYLQPVPIGLAGGMNLYGYANSNPLRFADSTGLASLVTDIAGRTTTFDPRPEDPNGMPITIPTHSDVVRRVRPGATDPFTSPDVNWIPSGTRNAAYGPDGSYIDTGDPRGRDIHGGGTYLTNPYAPRQGWYPTRGCTRGQNEDVRQLGEAIADFKRRHSGVPIPYTRR